MPLRRSPIGAVALTKNSCRLRCLASSAEPGAMLPEIATRMSPACAWHFEAAACSPSACMHHIALSYNKQC